MPEWHARPKAKGLVRETRTASLINLCLVDGIFTQYVQVPPKGGGLNRDQPPFR